MRMRRRRVHLRRRKRRSRRQKHPTGPKPSRRGREVRVPSLAGREYPTAGRRHRRRRRRRRLQTRALKRKRSAIKPEVHLRRRQQQQQRRRRLELGRRVTCQHVSKLPRLRRCPARRRKLRGLPFENRQVPPLARSRRRTAPPRRTAARTAVIGRATRARRRRTVWHRVAEAAEEASRAPPSMNPSSTRSTPIVRRTTEKRSMTFAKVRKRRYRSARLRM